VLKQGGPWDEPDRLVAGALNLLNDYVGYRPIAILETRPNTEFYPHEKVRPVPVALAGAGVGPGAYADIVRPALKLLEETEPALLEEASFDPAKLDELAYDPRAHDHFHPVNKRPNVLFGEWDPHTIDNAGHFRRFVLRQMTLDTLLTWVTPGEPGAADKGERLFERPRCSPAPSSWARASAGPGRTSTTRTSRSRSWCTASPATRDAFYQRLLKALPGAHGERLRAEAEKRKQPFAGVRQFLNQAISMQRASHLQDRRLAQLYAAMGYPAAARGQAGEDRGARRSASAPRFASARRKPGSPPTTAGPPTPPRCSKRWKTCSAAGSTAARSSTRGTSSATGGCSRSSRAARTRSATPAPEELIHIAGRQLDLYARTSAGAAVTGGAAARERLTVRMRDFAAWWDKYATSTVADMPRIVGGERADAAEHVADALTEWAKAGGGSPRTGGQPNSSDVAFWRAHRDGFSSPTAFAQVIDPLIERGEWKAAMGLLMTWLSESDAVPLDEPGASFEALAERWVRGARASEPAADRPALLRRFFELLDANATEDWHAPAEWLEGPRPKPRDDDEGNDFSSAYEGMTYKDSTDDGVDGSVAGDPPPPAGEFALEAQSDAVEAKLGFLHSVAKLWRLAARPAAWPPDDGTRDSTLGVWLTAARRANDSLGVFLDRLTEVGVPDPSGGHEGMIEFDRRRAIKGHLLDLGVSACVDVRRAALALAAARSPGPELAGGGPAPRDQRNAPPTWESLLTRIERAIGRGDADGVRALLPGFVALFRAEPLLYCPPSDGGKPREVLRAQTALGVLEDLVTRLPRLGLLRETFQLTKLARQMEWNNPPDGRRVSSFDQLFRTALTGVVETLLAAASTWGEDAVGEEGPLPTRCSKSPPSSKTCGTSTASRCAFRYSKP
jgi:hypothetical protein